MKKALLISLAMISLTDLGSVALAGISDFSLLKSEVLSFMVDRLEVPAEKIHIDYLRLPKLDSQKITRVSVFSQNRSKQVGHLILWAVCFNGRTKTGKYPLTVNVAVEVPVAVSKNRLPRNTVLNNQNIELRSRLVNKHFDSYYFTLNDLLGMETKQVVKEGMAITRAFVRPRPLLHKGDPVNIQVEAGDLVVSTPGIAREDGLDGEKIKVMCKKTRKSLYAIVASPTTVKIASGRIR